MRKCEGIEEVMVMEEEEEEAEAVADGKEVEEGVRMARAAKLMKKRKLVERELSFSSSLIQLKHRRRISSAAENLTSPADSGSSNGPLSSPSSDHALASCCSSNNSSQLPKQNFKIIDLQEEEASSAEIDIENTDERRRITATSSRDFQAESADLESITAATAPRPSEANSHRRSTAVRMMPSDAELEDFFSTAEKDLQKQFSKKYNFDIAKEEPLEGRYEWIRVKP